MSRLLSAHLCCAALALSQLPLDSARAQIAYDGTTGPKPAGTSAPFNAGTQTFTIDALDGTEVGVNLFHSFSDFQIGTGQTAQFTARELLPGTISNVVSRVTGSNVSTIDGTLRSAIAGADFYFVNPNGVVFDSNSSVNVPAGFHVSTADELRFTDGAIFSASNPGASTFTSAAPQAFGFLNSSIGSLTVRNSVVSVQPGSSISLVGGDLLIEATGGTNTFINAPAGDINLTAVAGAGLVPIDPLQAPSVIAFGNLTLRGTVGSTRIAAGTINSSVISNIVLRGSNVTVQGALVDISPIGSTNGGELRVGATGTLSVFDQGFLATNNSGSGSGADLIVNAAAVVLGQASVDLDSGIASRVMSGGTGPGGDLRLTANTFEVLGGSFVEAITSGLGSGGNVFVDVTGMFKADAAGTAAHRNGIASQTDAATGGDAGDITVNAGTVQLVNGGSLTTATSGAGHAGSIFVQATDILLDGGWITSTINGSGSASSQTTIGVSAANGLALSNGSSIDARTGGAQSAADIDLTATTVMVASSQIIGRTTGAGNASDIHVKADTFSGDAASIVSDSQGAGMPGTITLEGTSSPMALLTLANGSVISTSVGAPTLTALGGVDSIFIFADTIELLGDSAVVTNTSGQPSGGILHLTGHTLTLDGPASGLDTNTIAAGNGGDMLIEMDTINVLNGAFIKASTSSSGHAGVVTLVGNTLTVSGAGSALDVSGSAPVDPSVPSADGGTILIQMKAVNVLDGAQLRASTASSGNAGTIAVCCADSVLLSGAGSGAFANSGPSATGNAGRIIIKSTKLDLADGARLAVLSEGTGRGGTIVVKAQQMGINDPALGGGPTNVAQATGITTFISGTPGQTTASAGDVLMLVGSLNMYDGTLISTDSFGLNPAGDIEMRAGTVNAEGLHTLITSTANASSGQGDAGVIAIGAYDITFTEITLQTRSDTGAGGNLQLDWNGALTSTNTTFRTDVAGATTSGSAGSIYFGGQKLSPLTPQTDVCGGLCENFDPFIGVTAYDNAQATGDWFSSGDTIDASGGRGLVVVDVRNPPLPPPPPPSGPDVSALQELEGKVAAAPSFQMPKLVVAPDDDFQSPCAARTLGRSSSFTEAPAPTANRDPTSISPAYYTAAPALRGTNARAPSGSLALRGTAMKASATGGKASVFGDCKLRQVS